MLISSKHEELTRSASFILRNPQLYGVSVDRDNLFSIRELFESILTIDNWFWINIFDLETILEDSDFFEIKDDRVKLVKINDRDDFSLKIENKRLLPEIFFSPLLSPYNNKTVKLYGDSKVALLIAGHRCGDFEKAALKQFTRTEMEANGVMLENLGTGIFIAHDMKDNMEESVSKEKISRLLSELYIDLMLHELLYLEDEGHQSNACRYLYEQLPQREVETKLLGYLNDPDPNVRRNVYLGLSFPVYSAKVYLGQPMPSWKSLTEPFTLSLDTVRQITQRLQKEQNLDVLDNAIGTLKAQNYSGKLLRISKDVEDTLAKILPDLKDEQIIKDCKKLLMNLSLLNWKEKIKKYLIFQSEQYSLEKYKKLNEQLENNKSLFESNRSNCYLTYNKSDFEQKKSTFYGERKYA